MPEEDNAKTPPIYWVPTPHLGDISCVKGRRTEINIRKAMDNMSSLEYDGPTAISSNS
jgi:hypothetical protein